MKKVTLFATVLFVAAFVFVGQGMAQSAKKTVFFHRPAPLQDFFQLLVVDGGMTFAFDEDVPLQQTATLLGEFTPAEALDSLLSANGLGVRRSSGKAIHVARLDNLRNEEAEYKRLNPASQPVFSPAVSGRPDRLKLEQKSVESGKKIPITISAMRVNNGDAFMDDMILRDAIDRSPLISATYASVLSKTGSERQARDNAREEFSDDSRYADQAESAETLRRVAEYVVDPILTYNLKDRRDIEVTGQILNRIDNRLGGIIGDVANSRVRRYTQTVVFTLTLRFIDKSGVKTDRFMTCPQEFVFSADTEFDIARFIRGEIESRLSFSDVATKLVGNLGPPRACNTK